MLLYYITDRTQFSGSEAQRRSRLLQKIAEAARAGVDFIQLREKDLGARDLESLAHEAVSVLRRSVKRETRNVKLLVNHRTDIALATAADGVHLRSGDISAADARALLSSIEKPETMNFLGAVSCHSAADIALAGSQGADFAVFAPVFEKSGQAAPPMEAEEFARQIHRAAAAFPLRVAQKIDCARSLLVVIDAVARHCVFRDTRRWHLPQGVGCFRTALRTAGGAGEIAPEHPVVPDRLLGVVT